MNKQVNKSTNLQENGQKEGMQIKQKANKQAIKMHASNIRPQATKKVGNDEPKQARMCVS